MTSPLNAIRQQLIAGSSIWLFLDYDGTLSDFAPNPDVIETKPVVVELLKRLSQYPKLRVSVISGRRLAHVKKLVPLSGILLAGSYGIEICTQEGEEITPGRFWDDTSGFGLDKTQVGSAHRW
jgi:trehalose 6-phosphate phosphatase